MLGAVARRARARLPGAFLRHVPVRYIKATFVESDFGIVSTAAGDVVTVQGLSKAAPMSLVTFSNGSTGIVTDLHVDGSMRVTLVGGAAPPTPRDTVALHQRVPSFPCSPRMVGRVVNALGEPLDGLGPIEGATNRDGNDAPAATDTPTPSAGLRWPYFASDVPSIVERAVTPVSGRHTNSSSSSTSAVGSSSSDAAAPLGTRPSIIPTGFKAIDALHPLIAGRTTLLTGDSGLGKTTTVLDICAHVAAHNRRLLEAATGDGTDEAPIHIVYAAVGTGMTKMRTIVRTLRATGASAFTTVIAAPSVVGSASAAHAADAAANHSGSSDGAPYTAHAGMAYLTPFAGAALAEYLMRVKGARVLLIHDNLSAHFTAARIVSGLDWGATGFATPTCHGALFDRSAEILPVHMTRPPLPVVPVPFETWARGVPADIASAAAAATGAAAPAAATTADGAAVASTAVHAPPAVPPPVATVVPPSITTLALVDSIPMGPRFASVEHIKQRQLVAHLASLADNRIHLSRHAAKTAAALLPLEWKDQGQRPGHAAQGDALRHYAERACFMLHQLKETASRAAAAEAMGVVSESEHDDLLALHTKARLLLLPTKSLVAAASDGAVSSNPAEVARVGLQDAAFLSSNRDAEGALDAGGGLAALVGSSGGHGGPTMPPAAVKVDAPSSSAASTASTATTTASAPSTSLLDRMSPEQREAYLAVQAKRKQTSSSVAAATGRAPGAAASTPAGSVANAASASAIAARAASAATAATATRRAPSPLEETAAELASAAAHGSATSSSAASTTGRLRKPDPATRAAASQIVAEVVAATSVFSAAVSTAPDATIGVSLGDDPAALTARIMASMSGPHRGAPDRVFLSLFILTHAYVQRVPLAKLLQYEQGLYDHLRSLPYALPDAAGAAPAADAADEDCNGPARSTLVPTSSSVLEAAFACSLAASPAAATAASRLDLPFLLQESTLRMAEHVAAQLQRSARRKAALPVPAAVTAPAQQVAEDAALPSEVPANAPAADAPPAPSAAAADADAPAPEAAPKPKMGLFSWLFSAPSTVAKAQPPPISRVNTAVITVDPAQMAREIEVARQAALEAEAEQQRLDAVELVEQLDVRLDPGVSLADYPQELQALHVAVAEYTRQFCGEPQLMKRVPPAPVAADDEDDDDSV